MRGPTCCIPLSSIGTTGIPTVVGSSPSGVLALKLPCHTPVRGCIGKGKLQEGKSPWVWVSRLCWVVSGVVVRTSRGGGAMGVAVKVCQTCVQGQPPPP